MYKICGNALNICDEIEALKRERKDMGSKLKDYEMIGLT